MGANVDPLGRGLKGDTPEPPFAPVGQTSQEFNLSDLLTGPGLVYVTLQDRLIVTVGSINSSGTPCLINVRILRPDGQVITLPFMAASGNGGTVTSMFDMIEGFLLDCTVFPPANGSNVLGYAFVALARGLNAANATITHVLCKGYFSGNIPLGYPFSAHERQTQYQGVMGSSNLGNPAAGADFSYAVQANFRQRIISLFFTLTTSATAGTRQVTIIVDDGANTLGEFPANNTQAASLTNTYTASAAPYATTTLATQLFVPLPPDLRLGSTFRVRSLTAGLLAGDQFSTIRLLAETWFETQ